jgi:micrococcal nuclease
MKKFTMVIVALSVMAIATKASDDITEGIVVSVIDGNTIEVESPDAQKYKLLLVGIDCPELGQEYGEKAKTFLEKIILNKPVTITMQGKDRWGNQLAVVKIKGTKDPRVELLKEGLAWTAEKNPDPNLDAYKMTAQEKGRGLWQLENPTPPWTYRRQQTMVQPKSS